MVVTRQVWGSVSDCSTVQNRLEEQCDKACRTALASEHLQDVGCLVSLLTRAARAQMSVRRRCSLRQVSELGPVLRQLRKEDPDRWSGDLRDVKACPQCKQLMPRA